jgi:septum formation protein
VKLSRRLVLGSASPRRRELLGRLGLSFEVDPADIDESTRLGESPNQYVARLAAEKAERVASRHQGWFAVLAADTTVEIDGRALEKPVDLEDSARMLRTLRGREHVVHTSIALWVSPDAQLGTRTVSTRVRFREFSDETLAAYVASGEGLDKAGAYGIQDLGSALVSELHGSYTNVVGLPAAETIELLQHLGVLTAWP